jgi:hypothetical protein
MEKKRKKQILRGIITIIAFSSPFALFVFLNGRDIDARNKNVEDNGLFTIAVVEKYSPAGINTNIKVSPYVKIRYMVNGQFYETDSYYDIPDNDGPEVDSRYMAIYLPNDIETCYLLLNYPVRDSSDYKQYIQEFSKNRPKIRRGMTVKWY